jgi:hypothetical protein
MASSPIRTYELSECALIHSSDQLYQTSKYNFAG